MSETDEKSVKSRRRTSSFAGGQAGATWFRFLHAAGLRPAGGGASNRNSVIEDESPPSPTRSKRASQPPPPDTSNNAEADTNDKANDKANDKRDNDKRDSTKLPEKQPSAPAAPMSTTQTQSHPPLVVADGPPPSAHDAIVANFVRPAPERSQSSPALGIGAPAQALPPLAPSPEQQQVEDSRPVSSMLDGALEPSGTRVTRALGSQIEAVLAAQEEIGKAHLALEGWRTGKELARDSKDSKESKEKDIKEKDSKEKDSKEKDAKARDSKDSKDKESKEAKDGKDGKEAKEKEKEEEEDGNEGENSAKELERRAKGVEDIMTRLGELSVALKTYHSLGTPSLVFRSKPSPTPPAPREDDREENGFVPLFQSRSHQPPRKLAIRTDLTDDQSPALSPTHPPYVTIARPGTAAPPGFHPKSARTLTPGTIGPGAIGPGGLVGGERPILVGEKGLGGLVDPKGVGTKWTQDELMSAPASAVPGMPSSGQRVSPKRIPGLPRRSGSVPGLLGGMPVQSPDTMEARDRPW